MLFPHSRVFLTVPNSLFFVNPSAECGVIDTEHEFVQWVVWSLSFALTVVWVFFNEITNIFLGSHCNENLSQFTG
jgi:hypothetical protein